MWERHWLWWVCRVMELNRWEGHIKFVCFHKSTVIPYLNSPTMASQPPCCSRKDQDLDAERGPPTSFPACLAGNKKLTGSFVAFCGTVWSEANPPTVVWHFIFFVRMFQLGSLQANTTINGAVWGDGSEIWRGLFKQRCMISAWQRRVYHNWLYIHAYYCADPDTLI